jgi:hypothetical protein
MPVTVERKRFVTVSLAQHPHPGGTVKEGKAGMRCCEPVPTGIASWIENVYFECLTSG